jgi:hypothetical protein
MRLALPAAATAALTLAAGLAAANEVPVHVPVGAYPRETPFGLAGPSDEAVLRVRAKAGADYFLGLGTHADLLAELHAPDGTLLRAFRADASGGDVGESGAELHAPVTGVYTLRVSVIDARFLGPAHYPLDADAWAYPDCRDGPATRCTIAAGKTKAGVIGGSNDDDAFRVIAEPGRRYLASLTIADTHAAGLALVDARGRVLVGRGTGVGPAREDRADIRFVLPTSGGPYFLRTLASSLSHGGRGRYELTLARQP